MHHSPEEKATCKFLQNKRFCRATNGLAPSNTELTIDEQFNLVYYCIACLSTNIQKNCSHYEDAKE